MLVRVELRKTVMIALICRYHHHLVSKGATTLGMDRYVGVQDVAMPWLLPFFGLIAWGVIFDPADNLRRLVVLIVCVPITVGAFYAMITYLISGFLADCSRQK